MPSYLEGLAAEGYDARLGDVRAGYLGGMAAPSALVALSFELLGSPLVTWDVHAQIVQRVRLPASLSTGQRRSARPADMLGTGSLTAGTSLVSVR